MQRSDFDFDVISGPALPPVRPPVPPAPPPPALDPAAARPESPKP